jgi:aspartate oxidase
VYLDYRSNPEGFSFDDLPDEARNYLEKSGAFQSTPIERLLHMNPGAVELYQEHKIDLKQEPLEVAVCAQHNNGGLAGNIWYESTNIKHFFPVGEVNGSHGVTRPGGSALNAGQVAGFRAAEYIAHRYSGWTIDKSEVEIIAKHALQEVVEYANLCQKAFRPWLEELGEIQERMSKSGAHIRSAQSLERETPNAWHQVAHLLESGCRVERKEQLKFAFRVRQLAFAQAVYLESIKFALENGIGSRGSSIVLDAAGDQVHELLDASWKIAKENPTFRGKVLETVCSKNGKVQNQWVPCRPIPASESWFETSWARFRNDEIYS